MPQGYNKQQRASYGSYETSQMPMGTSQSSNMNQTMEAYSSGSQNYNVLRCPYCDKVHINKEVHDAHVAKCASKNFRCHICGHRSKYPSWMKAHMKTHEKDSQWPVNALVMALCSALFSFDSSEMTRRTIFVASHISVKKLITMFRSTGKKRLILWVIRY